MKHPGWLVVAAAALAVLLLCAWRYWLADDAWITFRVVDNALHGDGLRWNTIDRVQVYSHPLWMLVLLATVGVTREFVVTPLVASLLCTAVALATLAFRTTDRWPLALVVVALLGASKAFADYATSGLENALGYAIVAVAAAGLLRRDLRMASVCLGLAATTRVEWIVLLGPAVAWLVFVERHRRSTWIWLALGMLPFLLWEAFAVVYYGFPLPNPYYAKTATGLPLSERLLQGGRYLFDSFGSDPVTVGIVVLAPFAVFRRGPLFALACGALAASVLVVVNGGDFMSGRFFAVPFVAAVGALCAVPWEDWVKPPRAVLAGALAVLGVASATRVLWMPVPDDSISVWGIADERSVYDGRAGLAGAHAPRPPDGVPDPGIPAMPGEPMRPRRGPESPGGQRDAPPDGRAVRRDMAGRQGFGLGGDVVVVDSYGLGDPLLARVPALYNPVWRPGHHERLIPDGYLAEVGEGVPKLEDPELEAYAEDLFRVTRGPIFSPARWRAIVLLNLGLHGHHPDWDAWRLPQTRRVPAAEVAEPKAAGTSVREPTNVFFPREGVRIDFGTVQHAPGVEISVNARFQYWLVFLRGGNPIRSQGLPVRDDGPVLYRFSVPVPPQAIDEGYDQIWLLPREPAGRFAMGHLRLLQDRPPAVPAREQP